MRTFVLDALKDAVMAEAWDVELCRRINELESEDIELLDAEDVLARARKRIKDQRQG